MITKAAAPKSGWYQNVIPTTFFVGVELKSAIRRTMKELMCAPACGAIVWGFVIETAEIGVSLLNLQLPFAFDFDLCYHANAELLDCPEL